MVASCFIPHVPSVDVAEIMAIPSGYYMAAKIWCSSLIIESDSLVAVDALNQEEYFVAEVAVVLECKEPVLNLSVFEVIKCSRDGSGVADSIAKNFHSSRSSKVEELVDPHTSNGMRACYGPFSLL